MDRNIVFIALALTLSVGIAVAQPVRQVPRPPEIKAVRWQTLDQDYQDVFIDAAGRAWFLVRDYGPNTLPTKSSFLVCPDLPDRKIEFPKENHPLGFDRQNRFWEITLHSFGRTDIKTGKFWEYSPADGEKMPQVGQYCHTVCGQLVAHESGRVYILEHASRSGPNAKGVAVHIFDGDKHSYREMPATRFFRVWKLMAGPDRRVFVWCDEYAHGYEVHDGSGWKSQSLPLRDDLARFEPGKDGRVCVETRTGHAVMVGPEGDVASTQPADPTPGSPDELFLTDRVRGTDAAGRRYMLEWIGQTGRTGVRVFDPRQPAAGELPRFESFALNRTREGDCPVVLDSTRQVWARLLRPGRPFLSQFVRGQWIDHTVKLNWQWAVQTSQFRLLQPMKEGCMLAVLAQDRQFRFVLFDGQNWQVFDDMRKLVEANYELLARVLDNGIRPWFRWTTRSAGLMVDVGRRVWIGNAEERVRGAYDGKQWLDIPKGCCDLNAAGDACYTEQGVYDLSDWPPKTKAKPAPGVPKFEPPATFRSVLTDSLGRQWRLEPAPKGRPNAPDQLYFLAADGPSNRLSGVGYSQLRVLEQNPQTFWMVGPNSLQQLNVDRARVSLGRSYAFHMPGSVSLLKFGSDGSLWMISLRSKSGLYRICLPSGGTP